MKILKNYQKNQALLLIMVISALILSFNLSAQTTPQNKESIAVINIDAQGLTIKMPLMTSLVTLELERIDRFEVIDKYDVANHMEKNNIATNKAYGKTELIRIGKLMKVEKVLSGSVEKFGNKIIVVIRLIGIKSEKIEKVDVMEYIDQEEDIQEMIRISLHNIFGIENDRNTVEMLTSSVAPIANTKNKVNLSGPRFGGTMTFGKAGDRLQDSKDNGGFDMYPISSTFGYQLETQFIGSGSFQALFEFVGTLNALETGYMIPSLSTIIGFRFNKIGFEFGLGPVFRTVKTAEGFYDDEGNWFLRDENSPSNADFSYQIDNRGSLSFSSGLIVAAGVTFHSGQINFPVNLYVSPRKGGTVVGLVFGFNVANIKKRTKKN